MKILRINKEVTMYLFCTSSGMRIYIDESLQILEEIKKWINWLECNYLLDS